MSKLNLKNQKYGRLLALEPLAQRKNGSVVWLCKCDCGALTKVSAHSLRSGNTKSCGCLAKEIHQKNGHNNAKDLTNMEFGFLIALQPTEKRTNSGSIIWKCQCNKCGNITQVAARDLIQGGTKSCGCIKKSFGQAKIEEILNNANISYKKEYSIEGLNYKRFDFAIFDNDNNLLRLIEYDGQQHYRPRETGWFSKEKVEIIQQRDNEKNEWCLKNNISLVRIPYTEEKNLSLNLLLGDKYLLK